MSRATYALIMLRMSLLRMGHITYKCVMSRMDKSCLIWMGREICGWHSDSDDQHHNVGSRVSSCGFRI